MKKFYQEFLRFSQNLNLFILLLIFFIVIFGLLIFLQIFENVLHFSYAPLGKYSIFTISIVTLITTFLVYIAVKSYRDQLSILEDEISKRTKSEEILHNSQNLYKQLVTFSSDIIIVLENRKIKYINPEGVKLLLYDNYKDLLDKDYCDLIDAPQREETIREMILITSKAKDSFIAEETMIRKDKSELIIERGLFPYYTKSGFNLIVIGKSLMDLKRTEKALEKSEERFKIIVQNIQEYVYSSSYNNDVLINSYHSPKCADITGYTPQEYYNDPELWINMVHPEDKEQIYDLFKTFKRSMQSTVEHRLIHKNGNIKWISNTFTVISENENVYRIDGFILDITERVQFEKMLKDQNFFLQKLIDSIPNPIFYKEKDKGFKLINTAFEEFLGINKKEILEKNSLQLNSKLFDEFTDKIDNGLWYDDELINKEIDIENNDSNQNFLLNKVIFKNDYDDHFGVLGILLDVTKIKLYQNELKESLRIIKEIENIITKSPVIVFTLFNNVDLTFKFVSTNISIFNLNKESLLKKNTSFFNIIFEEDRKKIKENLNLFHFDPSKDIDLEFRIKTAPKLIKWVDCQIWKIFDDNNNIQDFQGVLIDKTERKNAEYELKESREKYKTLTENSYDLICELDNKNHIIYISPNIKDSLKYSPFDVLNSDIVDFIHLDDIPKFIQKIKKEFIQVSLRLKHQNGNWIWFEVTGKRFLTANNKERCVLIARDISERKKLEKQLIQSERLMAVGEMSAMIAHEFRNSLTSIKMIMQLLDESESISEKQRSSLRIALNSIKRMEDVVQQLLNYTHPAQMDLQIIDINQIIEQALIFPTAHARKKFIKINKRLDHNIPPVLIHSETMKDAIFNLLINSVQAFADTNLRVWKRVNVISKKIILQETLKDYDFSYAQETLLIKKKNRKDQEIIIPENSECIYIEISDNACGIDEAEQNKIFEPFFTTKEKGSGLGLPTVKRTINAHGGVIAVESKKDEGTTFKIYIPIKLNI